MATLIAAKWGLDAANAESLRAYLCIGAEETPELGWIEVRLSCFLLVCALTAPRPLLVPLRCRRAFPAG